MKTEIKIEGVRKLFSCDECLKTFSHRKSVIRHKNNLHNPYFREKFTCGECFKDFTYKFNLVGHLKKRHGSDSKSKPQIIKEAKCALCGECGFKKNILNHYKADHNIEMETRIMSFSCIEDFYSWKTETENKEMCMYVKERSLYRNKDGTTKMSFKCFRDGIFKRRGKNLRNIKCLGSNKMDGYCPARIDFANHDGKISIAYCRTHVGHDQELARIPLSKEERQSIADKIAQNIPFDNILNDIRENPNQVSRLRLLTKKDLFNIAQQHRLKTPKRAKKDLGAQEFDELIIYETIAPEEQLYEEFVEYPSPQTILPSLEERKANLIEKLTELVNSTQTHEELDVLLQVYNSTISTPNSPPQDWKPDG